MGKKKIEIKEIPDRKQRSVTFTKRRDGLFKKAETACQKFGGLQIGIVAFSPAGKPFTFCNSSSVSVDAIINAYMSSNSSSSSSSSSTSPAVVMGKRSRPDGDYVQEVIETEKKKRKTVMNDAAVITPPPPPPPPPPCITIQEEDDDEKLDQGFHYKNLVSDQELLTNELMGYGENSGIVTAGEMTMESSQFLVQDETHSWAPPHVGLQEIINLDDDFEYADHHHHHHSDETTTIMGLIPPHHNATTSTTSTSLCDFASASDMNEEEEEVGGSNEDDDDYGYTLEEWEQILSTSPTSAIDNSTPSNSYMMNQEGVVQAHWPSQEFLRLLCS